MRESKKTEVGRATQYGNEIKALGCQPKTKTKRPTEKHTRTRYEERDG